MKIDFENIYSERIKQIDIDIRKAINEKNWKFKAQLEAEKKKLKNLIS
ncbi:hypothetical protein ACER0A_002130 [Haloimpatiens sp. FM7315]